MGDTHLHLWGWGTLTSSLFTVENIIKTIFPQPTRSTNTNSWHLGGWKSLVIGWKLGHFTKSKTQILLYNWYIEMTKHKNILNKIVADDLVPQSPRASAAMKQSIQDMSIKFTYWLTSCEMNTNKIFNKVLLQASNSTLINNLLKFVI